MSKLLAILLLLSACVGSVLGAEEETEVKAKKSNFKVQGRLGLGMETNEANDVDDHFEVRLGVRTKRKEGVRAYIEVKANENSREIDIHDAFADYRNETKTVHMRGGRGKKIVGWEYEYSTSDRLSIQRSAGYQFMADRSLVGRDYFFTYEWIDRREVTEDPGEGENHAGDGIDTGVGRPLSLIDLSERWKLGISAHYDESKNSAFIGSAIFTPHENWKFGGWAALRWQRNQHTRVDTYDWALSSLYQRGAHRAAVEYFSGLDPYRTELEKTYGSRKSVGFGVLKGEYGFYIRSFNPYAVLSRVWKDTDHRGDYLDERTLGLRYFFSEGFNLAVELVKTKSTSGYDATTMPYDRTKSLFIARYFF